MGAAAAHRYPGAVGDRYGIATGYAAREEPAYFDDDADTTGYQPDVYGTARRVARRLRAARVIDVGAGSADKLAAIPGPLVALDFGANLARGAGRHPRIAWRAYDAERDERLPLDAGELAGSLLVCADVIEHLRAPERLLAHLRAALADGAACCLLSTPDRIRTYGADHRGPPPNPHHVREWSRDELLAFLRREGLETGAAGWTRSHVGSRARRTILVALADPVTLRRARLAHRPRPGVFVALRPHAATEGRILAGAAARRARWSARRLLGGG